MSIRLGNQRLDGFAKDTLSYNNITNCITEIPQDIKLELNSGTLTLKAGSKVYVPNGQGTFDAVTITSDLGHPAVTGNRTILVYKVAGSGGLNYQSTATMSSGPTDSLAGTPWHVWYDTTNNLIKRYTDDVVTPSTGHSLPIAIITVANGVITSIDQVFNGFGYIGSTVFVLPGLKGLIPDGRNKDGSLKNIEQTVTQVITDTRTSNGGNFVINITGPLSFDNGYNNFISSEIFPTSGYWICYKPSENKLYNIANGVNMGQKNWLVCGNIERDKSSPFKVLSIKSKTAFHAVDYNEADFVVAFQRPTAANNYTWYRKYRSGWVEQGGISTLPDVTFPITMADTNYFCSCLPKVYSNDSGSIDAQYNNKSTTGCQFNLRWQGGYAGINTSCERLWEVKGMAA